MTTAAPFAPIAYRPAQAAKAVGVTRQTLSEWIKRGDLPAYKENRAVFILHKDLEEFIQSMPLYIDQI